MSTTRALPDRPAWRRLASWDVVVGVLTVALLVLGDRIVPGVLSGDTVFFTLRDIGEVLLIALPMTLLIITGEIDLSVGSAVALSSSVIGAAYVDGVPMAVAVLLGIAAGMVGGVVNGLLVTRVGLNSLAVTIGTLGLYRGLCYVLLGDTPVGNFPAEWVQLGYGSFGGWFPLSTPLLVVAIVGFVVVLHGSRTGQAIYAIGINKEAARYSGIPVERIKFRLFVATGTMAGIGGVIYTLRFASSIPNAALGIELAVIAAILFGGASIFGGVGTLLGTVSGVLFLGFARAILRFASVPPNVLTVVTGGLLLASVIAPALVARWKRRTKTPEVADVAASGRRPDRDDEP